MSVIPRRELRATTSKAFLATYQQAFRRAKRFKRVQTYRDTKSESKNGHPHTVEDALATSGFDKTADAANNIAA